VRLTEPRLVTDPTRAGLPPIPRRVVGLIGVTQLIYVSSPTAGWR
jgi:hypothetical protein